MLNLWGYKLGKTCSAGAVQRTHAISKHKSTQLHLWLLRLNVRDIITNWKICVAGSYLIYRENCKGAHLPGVLEAFGGAGSGEWVSEPLVLLSWSGEEPSELSTWDPWDQSPEADFQTLHANIKTKTLEVPRPLSRPHGPLLHTDAPCYKFYLINRHFKEWIIQQE